MKLPGFKNVRVHSQLPPEELIRVTVALKQGALNDTGALCILTGKFTGRSPKDKFIVEEETTRERINWDGIYNNRFEAGNFKVLLNDMISYLDTKENIWQRTCIAGAHPEMQVKVNIYNEHPSGNLFACNMFLRPEEIQMQTILDEWLVLQAPDFIAVPEIHGTRAGNFSVISFERKTILIGGSGYTGEIKKGIFTVLNYLLPVTNQTLSMHCSANCGPNGNVALFFGLSGTGKTTLSTDPNRKLIGDDEHGWGKDSVFNFEGGCYAKIIGLSQSQEPEIFAAIKNGALVENAVFFPGTKIIDYNNTAITENTRVSYPLDYIPNRANPSSGNTPSTLFFLTCDATGVLPPLSKLTIAQAKYYFLSGYTSKIPGTEAEVKEPQPTFSNCFGAPFLPLHPSVYADLLGDKILESNLSVWLINTGWSGLPYPAGKRISIHYSRAMINAVLSGYYDDQPFDNFPIFNLQIPVSCPSVPAEILNPYAGRHLESDYFNRLKQLAEKFNRNFEQYRPMVSDETYHSGPDLKSFQMDINNLTEY